MRPTVERSASLQLHHMKPDSGQTPRPSFGTLPRALPLPDWPRFEIGRIYITQAGERIRCIARSDRFRSYEMALFSDGAYRYDRSTSAADTGRCTGSAHDYSHPMNLMRILMPEGVPNCYPMGRDGKWRFRLRRQIAACHLLRLVAVNHARRAWAEFLQA